MSIVNVDNKFAFIHIYKTGGTSIAQTLTGEHIGSDHTNARDLKIIFSQNNLNFNQFFKFSIVRNPYDWLVSLYFYCKKTPSHNWHERCNVQSFQEFIISHVSIDLKQQKNSPIGTNKCQTQFEFVTDESGELIVDFIMKKETLNLDFQLLKKLNIVDSRIQLPFINSIQSNRQHFMSYHTKLTIDIINRQFSNDFKLFGYDKV